MPNVVSAPSTVSRTVRRIVQTATGRPVLTATLITALACNIVLAGAYLWSKIGQDTTVRIEVRGQGYTVFIDGKLRNQATLEAPDPSGVGDLARDEDNARVRALYPCRDLYTANYAAGSITPDGRTPPPPGRACDD